MTTLATIRQAMTAFLAEAGIEALSAWPKEVWKGRKTPVAVVQVKEVEAGASGFQNYLGQTYDPAARQWTERYGRRITVKFGVTLYSPEAAGESGCQALLEQVAQAVDGVGGHALSASDSIVGGAGKSHLFKAV